MRLVILACTLEAFFLWIAHYGDLSRHPEATIVTLLLAGAVHVTSCYIVLQRTGNYTTLTPSRLTIWVLAPALAFRLTLFPLPPTLSDDVFRYRWEGKLQAAAGNPYTARPNDARWESLRDATFYQVPGRDFKAVYGPLAQLVERATYLLVSSFTANPFRQAFWFKLPYALCDAATIGALCWLLGAHGLAQERVLIYAWSPLPVLEFWASGHNDALAILMVVLALGAARRERWLWAFAALTLGAAAKLWPAMLIPIFVGWKNGRPLRPFQWLIAIPIAAALALPYWTDISENARFVSGFVGGWRNNDSLFELLLRAGGDQYVAKYAAFAVQAATILFVTWRGWPLAKACLTVLTVTLMISANVHPWYLTWLLPCLAFHPEPALLLWTCLAPLAHVAVIRWKLAGEWEGISELQWYEYIPVYGMLCTRRITEWMRRSRA